MAVQRSQGPEELSHDEGVIGAAFETVRPPLLMGPDRYAGKTLNRQTGRTGHRSTRTAAQRPAG